jgi:glucokinase
MAKLLLGFDIGGTKIGIGLGDENGKLLGQRRIDNIDTDPDVILPQMLRDARELAEAAGVAVSDIAAFGISAPFPADAKKGILLAPTNNKRWNNVPILDTFRRELGIPGCFENDANCGALAEWYFGAARNCRNFIYLTMSTGIGGGIVAEGKLVRGGNSLSAGEMGHICLDPEGRKCNCGQRGCYETFCGGRAVADRMREELAGKTDSRIVQLAGGAPEKIDMRTLEQAVREGDGYALKLWDEMAFRNAQAIGMFINIFNPEKIVLGTLAWAVGKLYTDPIMEYLPRFSWPQMRRDCEIVCSELRRDIGSYAGIAAAMNHLREHQER